MNPREHKLIGESDSFLRVLEQVSALTQLNRPILVVGERGTGKELIAERVHYLSERWDKPLLKMNCAAMHEALLESELFGHESGAFTGANRRHIGRFERASGGTLFLDELATLSTATQDKLLRVIEYGDFERLGGSETLKADTRLVAATNVDLPQLADAGKFRHDLLDRLAFDVVTLPPLRERTEDILLLAQHFAVQMCKELGRAYFSGFSPAAERALTQYSWPGNIRELKNVVERSVYRQQQEERSLEDINFDPFASPYRLSDPKTIDAPDVSSTPSPKTIVTDASPRLPTDFHQCRSDLERSLLQQALQQANYNQKTAAKLLHLSYHQFRNQLKKHLLLSPSTSEKNS